MKEEHRNGTIYTSRSIYVDIETGEVLTTKEGNDRNKYLIIKTTKETKYDRHKIRGYITYTRECTKNPQQRLAL